MLLTEGQAKGKTCCGPMDGGEVTACVASGCMAWRWAQHKNSDLRQIALTGEKIPCGEEGGCGLDDPNGMHNGYAPAGYCGLAGKPEVG